VQGFGVLLSQVYQTLAAPASRRSEGTDDEWVELECIESPEQIEDESKASKTSVSACVKRVEDGR
jgi:hypothetical protein